MPMDKSVRTGLKQNGNGWFLINNFVKERIAHGVLDLNELCRALASDGHGDFIFHSGSFRAFTLRIRENMSVKKTRFLDKLNSFVEVFFGLSGETDNYVRREHNVRDRRADPIHSGASTCGIVFSAHKGKNARRAALQGDVKMRCKRFEFFYTVYELLPEQRRIERAEPYFAVTRNSINFGEVFKNKTSQLNLDKTAYIGIRKSTTIIGIYGRVPSRSPSKRIGRL